MQKTKFVIKTKYKGEPCYCKKLLVTETCASNIVVKQKLTKTIICLKSVMVCMIYFAGARVQQACLTTTRVQQGNLYSSIAKSALPLVKKGAKTLGKQVLQSGVEFASDVLHGKNVKQAAIDQAKTAGSNLLQVAQQKIGKRKTAPRKVQKKKRKRHCDIFT